MFYVLAAGESLDEESVAQLVCMYIGLDPEDEGLGLYQRELEDLLLASTKQFYDRKAREWIASSTFAEYLQLTEVSILDARLQTTPAAKHRFICLDMRLSWLA